VPPHGVGGGYPANAGIFYPVRNGNIGELLEKGVLPTHERFEGEKEDVRSKLGHIKLDHDTVFVALSGGGGGVGDPLLRDPEAVARDVAFAYTTPEHAADVYGVVVTDDHQVDEAATAAKRAEIRKARIGDEPSKDLQAPASIGVSLLRNGSGWTCGSCDEQLAAEDGNWREGSVLSENPIAERYAEMGMQVRDRKEAPRVMLREHFCPSCAMSLGVDVVTDETETLKAPASLGATVAA
jgi:N-methylhydantoinase B